jgi:hypothetical protein
MVANSSGITNVSPAGIVTGISCSDRSEQLLPQQDGIPTIRIGAALRLTIRRPT